MSFRTRFLKKIPDDLLKLVFAINVVFLLLLGFSALHVEPGTSSFVVAVLTFVSVSIMLVTVAVIWYLKPNEYAVEV